MLKSNIILLLLCFCIGLNAQPRVQTIDSLVQKYYELNLFNGTVLVAHHEKIIFEKAYGLANKELIVPNSVNTRFRIGSISKQFTAMLVMQLKQRGKIDLQATVSDYLPWYRKDVGKKVTVFQLLSQTSGIPTYTDGPNWTELYKQHIDHKEFALKYCSDSLEFAPGTQFKYSNSNYFLLGLIIEAVTKSSFDQVLQKNILDVAGMQNTGIDYPDKIIPNRAAGYDYTFDGYANSDYIDMASAVFGCGAMYSTVEDLQRWDAALRTEKLLSEANKKIMFTPVLNNYAMGLWVRYQKNFLGTNTDVTTMVHAGGINGFSSFLARTLEDDNFIILLDNSRAGVRGGFLDAIVGNIAMALYDKPAAMPKPLPTYALYDSLKNSNIEKAIAYYQILKKTEQSKYNFKTTENDLNNLGDYLTAQKRTKEAILIYQLNTEENPSSSDVHAAYGTALEKDRQRTNAIKSFKKSLELDPNNKYAADELKKLDRLSE